MSTMTDVSLDISEEAMRKLERTQMLQSLGRLTAGIAHEINTPIQFIGDNLHFLSEGFDELLSLLEEYEKNRTDVCKSDLSDNLNERIVSVKAKADMDFFTNEVPKAIAQSIDGIKRVSSMISAMRDFSHIDERRFDRADLNKAVKSTVVILRNEVKYVADVKMDLDYDMPAVMCCIDEIQQVFLNLIINAAHSIGDCISEGAERGLITISSRVQDNYAVFTISDTGKGISPDIREKIFEPFFTTKSPGHGTGQGLSIVRSVVLERHRGKLDLESSEGVGTTFIIYIPIEGESRYE